MISVYDPSRDRWTIQSLAEAGVAPKPSAPDIDKVNEAWCWLCLNGEWVAGEKGTCYTSASIVEALKIAATK